MFYCRPLGIQNTQVEVITDDPTAFQPLLSIKSNNNNNNNNNKLNNVFGNYYYIPGVPDQTSVYGFPTANPLKFNFLILSSWLLSKITLAS